MRTHVENDRVISRDEHNDRERVMNAHSKQFARVLRVGENGGEKCERGCKDGLRTTDSKISDLRGLRKDHKKCENLVKGPPLIPIVGASGAMNAPLSKLIGDIIDAVAEVDDEGTISDSTEDMIARIRAANEELKKEENRDKEFALGSLDVKALYPSLQVDESAAIIRQVVEETDVKIDVNDVELSLYLVSTMTQGEVDEEGWTDCCHSRLSTGSRRPGITTKEIIGNRGDCVSLWRDPTRRPDDSERKKMIAKAVETAVKMVMTNNSVYQFDNEILIQEQGMGIGVKMTGDVAKGVRRLRNTHEDVPKEEVAEINFLKR